VGGELIRAWSARGEADVVAALRRTAASPAPAWDDLARVGVPAGVVAFVNDAFHSCVRIGPAPGKTGTM
jgi:hypothetical protein